jgi:hypothetical protein
MAKLVFPNITATAYRAFISGVRVHLTSWKRNAEKSPGLVAELGRQINPFLVSLGAIGGFVDGTDINVRNSADSKDVTGDAVVDETTGALTEVALPATAALITSGQALTGVTPTGTFTTTVTFTVAGGVITAIALS